MAFLHHLASGFEFLTGFIAVGIGVAAWRRQDQTGARALVCMAAGAAGWAWCSGLSSLLPTPWLSTTFGFAVYPFAMLAVIGWFLLVAAHTGRDVTGHRPTVAGLASVVALDAAVVATTGRHHLFAAAETSLTAEGFLVPVPGPLYWVHMALSTGFFLVGLGMLLAELRRARGVYQEQTRALVGAGLVAMGLTVVEVLDILPVPGLGIGVVGLTAGGLLVLWTLFDADFLDVVPVRRDALMEGMDDAVLAVDHDDRLVDLNPAAAARFDVPDSAVGTRASTALSNYPTLVGAVSGAESGRTEVSVDHGDRTRHYEVRVSPVDGRGGGGLASDGPEADRARIVVVRDVTTRKERVRRLQQFRSVVETAGDPILVLGAEDAVEIVNGAMLRFLGSGREGVVGEPVREVLPASAARKTTRTLDALREGDVPSAVFEFDHDERDGRSRRYEVHLRRIGENAADGSAEPPGAVGIFRDVTEHEERKAELDLLSQILTRVLRHNIRNDLNVIAGNAAVLRRRLDGDDARMAATIEEKSRAVTDLADNAHAAHRITAAEASTTVLDLRRAVEVAVASVARNHPEASVHVAVPDVAVVAAQEFEIAVENLVENAIVHNDGDEPTVEVRATVREDWVDLTVEDDGPGIDTNEVRAVERDEETDLSHASGLGLWIVTWIVDQSGGTIEFDADRTGTTVTIGLANAADPPGRNDEVSRGASTDAWTGRSGPADEFTIGSTPER